MNWLLSINIILWALYLLVKVFQYFDRRYVGTIYCKHCGQPVAFLHGKQGWKELEDQGIEVESLKRKPPQP